ncbi:MAG: hypothetical protein Q9M50_10305 [Methylococcales bacterium]|nr:hypothetical protein [Methylococcales bacterium]
MKTILLCFFILSSDLYAENNHHYQQEVTSKQFNQLYQYFGQF